MMHFCVFLALLCGAAFPLPAAEVHPEQAEILHALKTELGRNDLIFTIDALNIRDGWAWIQTRPASLDGRDQFEDICALLRKKNGQWTVVELPCAEEDNPDCLGSPFFPERLRQRVPAPPPGLVQ